MGNCIRAISNASNCVVTYRIRSFRRQASTVKSIPICWDRIRWTCQVSLTASQLKRKRDEFWDTAPSFDGRKEIWDALKAAVDALYKNELEFAQAIIDGANIIAPTGSLLDCYDELGSRYQIPVYVLWDPLNLTDDINLMSTNNQAIVCEELSSSESSQPVASSVSRPKRSEINQVPACSRSSNFTSGLVRLFNLSRQDNTNSEVSPCSKRQKRWRKYQLKSSSKSISQHPSIENQDSEPCCCEKDVLINGPTVMISLKLRFSSGEDYTCSVFLSDTIAKAKQKVEAVSYWPAGRQRWFCAGKILPNHAKISDCHIPEGFVVQVIVHSPFEPESVWNQIRQAHMQAISTRNTQLATTSISVPMVASCLT